MTEPADIEAALESAGPVEWEEDCFVKRHLIHTEPPDGRRGWYVYHGASRTPVTEREAHALTKDHLPEWLCKDGQTIRIYGPDCCTDEGLRATEPGQWQVIVFDDWDTPDDCQFPVRWPAAVGRGASLLDALIAAVREVGSRSAGVSPAEEGRGEN